MQIHRIHTAADPAFESLVDIYCEAIPASERKSFETLARMLERPEYLFLVAHTGPTVVAFSVVLCFRESDAALLEYMAVRSDHRGHGIGQFLFRETLAEPPLSNRHVLAEVDSEYTSARDAEERLRRKTFYRRMGCREIEGLVYRMPRVSGDEPPEMDFMIRASDGREFVGRAQLRQWLQACYTQAYGRSPDDPGIEAMMAPLPDRIRLRHAQFTLK